MTGKGKTRGKYIALLIGNLVLVFALYLTGMAINETVTLSVYTAVLAGFSFGYVIYNRAFTRNRLTPEMLRSDWSDEKKAEYIGNGKQRLEKSKWMLTVLIPLIAVLLYELADIYLIPLFRSLIGI